MRRVETDVVVIGSSFAGSLTALILRRMGIDVVLIDRQRHPRFAIGESSTPAADLVLADLCDRYDLPRLKPLAKYGTWRDTHPELRCGLKRGFSYFHHRPGEAFQQDADHSNELLVTASRSDEVGDTHWVRADVDSFFTAEAVAAGAGLFEETTIDSLEKSRGWQIGCRAGHRSMDVRCRFIIDSSGASSVLPAHFGFADRSQDFRTSSRAVFAHYHGIARWKDRLVTEGGDVSDHPFDCDAAALHHIFDGAWMWILPFDGDLTSVGLVLDTQRHPELPGEPPISELARWLSRYPAVAAQFRRAEFAFPFDSLRRIGRMQRFRPVPTEWPVDDWTMLPGSMGVVDPFYSTGIAQSLLGVERVTRAFEDRDDKPRFGQRLRDHLATTESELHLIDQQVAAAYRTFGQNPQLLGAISMLYFAGTTTWEQRRAEQEASGDHALLLADDRAWRSIVDETVHDLSDVTANLPVSDTDTFRFAHRVERRIAPYNRVGLFDLDAKNMYRYTAAPNT